MPDQIPDFLIEGPAGPRIVSVTPDEARAIIETLDAANKTMAGEIARALEAALSGQAPTLTVTIANARKATLLLAAVNEVIASDEVGHFDLDGLRATLEEAAPRMRITFRHLDGIEREAEELSDKAARRLHDELHAIGAHELGDHVQHAIDERRAIVTLTPESSDQLARALDHVRNSVEQDWETPKSWFTDGSPGRGRAGS
jgi:hypothetical protein